MKEIKEEAQQEIIQLMFDPLIDLEIHKQYLIEFSKNLAPTGLFSPENKSVIFNSKAFGFEKDGTVYLFGKKLWTLDVIYTYSGKISPNSPNQAAPDTFYSRIGLNDDKSFQRVLGHCRLLNGAIASFYNDVKFVIFETEQEFLNYEF